MKFIIFYRIESEALDTETLYKNIKELMKSAETFEGKCDVFICNLTKDWHFFLVEFHAVS